MNQYLQCWVRSIRIGGLNKKHESRGGRHFLLGGVKEGFPKEAAIWGLSLPLTLGLLISQNLHSDSGNTNDDNDNGTGYYDINSNFLKTLPGKELRFE